MGLPAKRLALEPGDRLVQVAVHPYLDELTGAPLFWHVVKDGTPTSLAVLRSRLRGRLQLRRQ